MFTADLKHLCAAKEESRLKRESGMGRGRGGETAVAPSDILKVIKNRSFFAKHLEYFKPTACVS